MKYKIKNSRKTENFISLDGSLEKSENVLDEQNVDFDAFKYQTTFSTLRPFMGGK